MIGILFTLVPGTLPPLSAEEPQVAEGQIAEPQVAESQVEEGRLDLSDYSFEQQGPLKLDGKWRFMWRELLEPPGSNEPAPSDAEQPAPARHEQGPDQQPPQLIPVPGRWSPSILPEAPKSGYGYGTYLLNIRLPAEHPEEMGLKIGFIGTAARLYLNGRLIYSSGTVGKSPETAQPEWRPEVVSFQPETRELQLLVQVSSYRDRSSGVNESIYLGSAKQVRDLRQNRLMYDMFLFGALIIMGIYHLGLYYFRRSDRSPLYFALFTFVLATRIVVYEELAILKFMPDLPWALLARIGYITFTFGVIFFFRFIHCLFKEHVHPYAQRLIEVVALFYTLLIVVFPSTFYMRWLSLFQLFTVAVALYVFYILFQAARHYRPGAWLFIIGFSLLFITVVHDIAKTMLVLPSIFLVPFGLLIFVLFQSMVMTQKFAKAFQKSEQMSAHLLQLNESMERFVPREFLRFLKKENVMEIKLGDHANHRMTVLFADIRDFTSLSEKLTPEENFRFINSFLSRMGPIIRAHRGFVDKYMGDGIMALFPDRAEDAVEAAIHLREELVQYNQDRSKVGYQPINFGVGLHTGELMLGTVGENQRMDGTVISDAVNLASRVEALTKKLHIGIAISEATHGCLSKPEQYEIRYVGKEWVKGKAQEVSIFEVAGRKN
ncbi:MAG TPA: adenylate/guanylate cyclase domain-containing protein [Clostridia bacterium]|nr:adenylate/guanylate cyclase domain-containing protein [Clostridia bacterium]